MIAPDDVYQRALLRFLGRPHQLARQRLDALRFPQQGLLSIRAQLLQPPDECGIGNFLPASLGRGVALDRIG